MSLFKTRGFWYAIFITLLCSLVGKYLATLPGLSLVGPLVIALILGMLFQLGNEGLVMAKPGIGFVSNKFIRLGIILLGFRLNLIQLAESGVKTIALAAVGVTMTIFIVYFFCKMFKVEDDLAILTASGCGICGAAAVMGISPQVKAKEDNAVLAVAVVCILGTIFTLVEIAIAPLLHFSETQLGFMSGLSLHEIAHAVAAGSAFGPDALDMALITKLSRVLLLAPVAVIIGIIYGKKQNRGKAADEKVKIPIPWFMGGFLLASAATSFLPLPQSVIDTFVSAAYLFLGMAMAALGMSVNFKVIIEKGGKVFLAATMGSIILLGFAIAMAKIFF
ncbi:YeiH family protein [Listeria costaricensis]|uniref:YeiH family protein n=1 Tax=Listeria costaricensis TaxID=2026604 RepID=UPI000C077F42|nr:putative sulfate exporter family transporter [Listeria costaricensis]